MARRALQSGSILYTVADDDRAAGDLLPQAVLRCRVIDELTLEPPKAPVTVSSSVPGVTPRVGEGGICGLVARPRDIAAALLTPGGLDATVTAPGFLPRDLTPAIDGARRALTIGAGAGATGLTVAPADPAPRQQFRPGRGVYIARANPTEPDQFATVADISPPPAAADVPIADPVDPPLRPIGTAIAGVPVALPDQPLHRDTTLALSGRVQRRSGNVLVPAPAAQVSLTGIWLTYPDSLTMAPLPPDLCAVAPPLRFACAPGSSVDGCTFSPVGPRARLQLACDAGATTLVAAPNAGLNPLGGDTIRIGLPGEPEEEVVITAGFDLPSVPAAPVTIRLRTPAGQLHRAGEPVQLVQPQAITPVGAVTREGQAGDSMLFAPGMAALPTTGWIIIDRLGPTASVHRAHQLPVAAPHLIAPDATAGRFTWPPIGRVAQIRVQVSLPPLAPVTRDVALDYTTPPTLSVILT